MTVRNGLVTPLFCLLQEKGYKLEKLSKPYRHSGGHSQECIGHAVHYAKMGHDGLVQIYPMTCMRNSVPFNTPTGGKGL